LLDICPKEKIKAILGDREFLCKELLEFLCKNEMRFVLRSKDSYLAQHHNGGMMSIKRLIGETRSEILVTKNTKMWCKQVKLTYYKSSGSHEALY
jgi:hypothetical protein